MIAAPTTWPMASDHAPAPAKARPNRRGIANPKPISSQLTRIFSRRARVMRPLGAAIVPSMTIARPASRTMPTAGDPAGGLNSETMAGAVTKTMA